MREQLNILMAGCGILEHKAVSLNSVLSLLRTSPKEVSINLVGAYNTTDVPARQTFNKWLSANRQPLTNGENNESYNTVR